MYCDLHDRSVAGLLLTRNAVAYAIDVALAISKVSRRICGRGKVKCSVWKKEFKAFGVVVLWFDKVKLWYDKSFANES